ncbi:chromosome segregation ATPase [Hamiltosporidium tvaerminnensis]|uniref:Chromosome segregation ATPase n=1 Tax=Hamiltosporidium tvaerminnensis TaxID=1176355 RepID=A0A4Q9KWE6_9MICR|nr:chromosome segregation ATPase [Hamiltosporidium tvaerminnensis]
MSDTSIDKPLLVSIELKNFMCHKHLFIEFNKMMTCIGGRNGSGKSAIMIAIGLLFGQRAYSLERGNSYKNLIKDGEINAKIRVVLRNIKNYKRSFFKDFIIIEKRLRKDSAPLSIYNLKNNLFSSKKEDLDYILDLFSLRLDNPLNFLTQEQSKKFLNISKPELLYSLFTKGTELEDMTDLHVETENNILQMKQKIDMSTLQLKKLLDEQKIKTNCLEAIYKTKEYENKLKNLESEKEWSRFEKKNIQIIEKERNIKEITENICEFENEKNNFIKELDFLIEDIENTKQERERFKRKHQTEVTNCENKLNNLELQNREISNDLNFLEENLNNKILKKNEMNENISKYLNSDDKRVEKDIKNKKNKILEFEKDFEKLLEIKNEALEEEKKCFEAVNLEMKSINEQNNKIFQLKNQISYFEKVEKNLISFFNENMPNIMNEIKSLKTKDRIIGPIGLYIQLKEHKWYKPVSIILKDIISSFIVFNSEDRESLNNIFKKYNYSGSILLPSLKNNKEIKFEENKKFKTVLNVLNIKETVVLNQLIIFSNIEQIILIESRKEAYSVIKSMPLNVDSAYTIEGDRIKMFRNSLSDYRPRNSNKFYFENSSFKIENLKDELKNLKKTEIKKSAEEDLKKVKKLIMDTFKRIDDLEKNKRNILSELKCIESVQSNKENIKDDFENLDEEIERLKTQKKHLSLKLSDIKNEIENCKNEICKLKEINFNETQDTNKIINTKRLEIQLIDSKISSTKFKLQDIFNEKYTLEIQLEKEKEILKSKYKEICNPRNLEEIIEEENIVLANLQISKNSGIETEIKKDLIQINKKIKFNQKIISNYESKIFKLSECMKKRIEKREALKITISEQASIKFEELTAQRKCIGKLFFNHDEKKLEVTMKIDNTVSGGSKNTLSGGERSYSGICLLLSFWSFLSCPIKILDEFDVYMDNITRKYAIRSLLEFLSEKNSQVILITPLNTKDLFSEFCEIIVLESPRK